VFYAGALCVAGGASVLLICELMTRSVYCVLCRSVVCRWWSKCFVDMFINDIMVSVLCSMQERCVSLVEQFWTYVIWEDDNGKEEDIHNSVMVRASADKTLEVNRVNLCSL